MPDALEIAHDQEQKLRRNFEDTVKFFGLKFAERVFSPDEFARFHAEQSSAKPR